jgi:hypothetical protein
MINSSSGKIIYWIHQNIYVKIKKTVSVVINKVNKPYQLNRLLNQIFIVIFGLTRLIFILNRLKCYQSLNPPLYCIIHVDNLITIIGLK